jgi:hypothetical protein
LSDLQVKIHNMATTQSLYNIQGALTNKVKPTATSQYNSPIGPGLPNTGVKPGVVAGSPANNLQKTSNTLPAQYQSTTNNTSVNSVGYTKDAQNNVFDAQGNHVTYESLPKGSNGKPLMNLDALPAKPTNSQPGAISGIQGGSQPTYQAPQAAYGTANPPTLPNLLAQQANIASQPSPAFNQTLGQAQAYNQALQQSRINEAQGLAANAQNPIPLEFQQGRAQVLQSQYAQEQAALAGAYQGAAGLVPATTTQQNVQQQGLLGAAALAQPQAYGITQTPYNPVTNQYGAMPGGSNGAFSAGQTLGNVNLGQSFQQTIMPAFNAAGGIVQSFNNWIDAPGQSGLNGINPTDVNLVNQLKGWVEGANFSDPRYPQLSQFLNEFLNTLSPVIGSPGEVTNYKQSIVNSLLNPSSSASSLKQQAQSLYSIASQKIDAIQKTGQAPAGLGVGANTYNNIYGTQGGGLYNF